MNKPKQATLFQSWGSKSQTKTSAGNQPTQNPAQHTAGHDTIDFLDDDDEEDQELARALEESLAYHQNQGSVLDGASSSHQPSPAVTSVDNEDCNDGDVSFGIEEQDIDHGIDRSHCLPQLKSSDGAAGESPGFDHSAGQLWIYPTNYPVREYQFSIVQQALVKNTLVTLPTGLGKTFIASVVMYNFYRWYPEGKVVFMAPTKPLVAQQIDACYNIMGIPQEDTAEMTGSMNPTERQKAWQDRRVFFLTPQVMTNDLGRGTCAAELVKCVVVDEAHKALGNHAYCQVIRELMKYTHQFRVLALSATPGSDIKSVQNVISNLAISHIELRSEESPDIKPYTHERTVDKIVVPLGDELNNIKTMYIQVLSVVVKRLVHLRVLYNREATSLSKYLILKAREAFRQNPPESLPRSQYGIVEGDFALAMSLYHGFELLQLHGLRSLFNFLDGIISGNKAYGRTRTELMRNADFNNIMDLLRDKFQPSPASSTTGKPVFLVGHPKMAKLEEVVLQHFQKFEAEGQATRVMIFSQYRDSVQEITTLLQQHQPLVKVMSFIGQSSVGKATKGFTQKEQLKVMQAFRTGDYNTLVSTCVGEEGLDIGDVDLIVCFDAHKSPIRLVQRMGRTGRKRQGRIVMLMTEGKEEQIYNHSQYTKRSIHRVILNGARSLVFYANNPRMIPGDLTPACHRMHITVQPPQSRTKQKSLQQKGRRTQGRLPKLFSKAKGDHKKSDQEEAGISLQEFGELKSVGCAVTVKRPPLPKMLTLDRGEQSEPWERDSSCLNFSDWLPWQNCLQQTAVMGHSRRSHHLVELLEFTDLQQMLPAEEDNYGQEMGIYLDMDDVFPDCRRPVSNDITQFVVPSPRNQETKSGTKEVARPESREVAVKKTKRHHLPALAVDHSSEDSDALPEVDFSIASESVTRLSNTVTMATDDRQSNTVTMAADDRQSNTVTMAADDRLSNTVKMATDDRQSNTVTRATDDKQSNTGAGDGEFEICNIPSPPPREKKPRKRSHRAVDSKADGHSDGSHSDSEKYEWRIPTPPPVDEIPTLLSLIQPEDWLLVDVESIIGDYKTSRIPHFTTFRLSLTADSPDQGNDLKMECLPVDSLSDCDFDVLQQKLLPKCSRAKKRKSERRQEAKSGSPGDSKAQTDEVVECPRPITEGPASCHGPISQLSELSQTELLSKKPLFKHCDTNNLQTENLAAVPDYRTNSDINSGKQKAGFVYSLSQSSTQSPPEKTDSSDSRLGTQSEKNPLDMVQSLVSNTAAEKKCTEFALRHGAARDTTASPSDWITGRQLLVSETEGQKATGTCEQSAHNSSMSDSFLQKNFLDNDRDLEVLETVVRKSPELLTGRSAPTRPGTSLETAVQKSPELLMGRSAHTRPGTTLETAVQKSPELLMGRSAPTRPGTSLETAVRKSPQLLMGQSAHTRPRTSVTLSCSKTESSSNTAVSVVSVGSEQQQTGRNTSMLSFTHALACVHSHSASEPNQSDSNKDSVEDVLDGYSPHDLDPPEIQMEHRTAQEKTNQLQTDDLPSACAEGESPNFDLGFDFDEDIIPPSPEAEMTVSQLAGKSIPSKLGFLFSVNKGNEDSGKGKTVSEADELDNDEYLFQAIEQDSPCFASSFPSKQGPDFGLSKSQDAETSSMKATDVKSSTSILKHAETPGMKGTEVRPSTRTLQMQSDSLQKSNKRKLTLSHGPRSKLEQAATHVQPEIGADFKAAESSSQGFQCHGNLEADAGNRTVENRPNRDAQLFPPPRNKTQLRLSSIGTSHPEEGVILENMDSFSESWAVDAEIDNDFELEPEETDLKKTPLRPEKFAANVYCSTPVSSKKRRSLAFSDIKHTNTESSSVKPTAFPLDLRDDDESDFEDNIVVRKKARERKLASSDESAEEGTADARAEFKAPPQKQRQAKKRKRACSFLDDEAQLSDDVMVSSDEADEDHAELLEGSFIDNCTQMTQASQIDMQAVYMKSVGSLDHHGRASGGKFRLQYNYAPTNVYSQLPYHEEEESQYQEDSFCVGSEEEEESDSEEVDISTEITGKQVGSSRGKRPQATRQVKGRRRVRLMADSSSNEEEDLDRLPPSQMMGTRRIDAVRRALESSSEDNLEVSALEVSPAAPGRAGRKPTSVGKLSKIGQGDLQGTKSSQGFHITLSDESQDDTETSGKKQAEDYSSFSPQPWLSKNKPLSNKKSSPCLTASQTVSHTCGGQLGGKSPLWDQTQVNVKGNLPGRSPMTSSVKQTKHLSPSTCAVRTELGEDLDRQVDRSAKTGHRGPAGLATGKFSTSAGTAHHGDLGKSGSASSSGQKTFEESAEDDLQLGGDLRVKKSVCGDGGDADQGKDAGVSGAHTNQDSPESGIRFTTIANTGRGKAVILVDSREISGAQDILSALRLEHNAQVCTRQLAACDYILSNRLAVERLTWSVFSNGASRNKLWERVQQMQWLFDRCVLIVEKDRVKPGEEKNTRPIQHSKYVDSVLAQLNQTAVRLFFTDSQAETARLLAQLTTVECRKGMAITAPVQLTPQKEQVVKLYLSIPRLTITHALNLCFNFTSIQDFMSSSVNGIQTKGHMSFSRATQVVNFLRRRFSPALMSNKYT